MKLRPCKEGDVERVQEAIVHLQKARDLLKGARCPKTVARVRLALTSAQGAERHVHHRAGSWTVDDYIEHLVMTARVGKPWRGRETASKAEFTKFVMGQVDCSVVKVGESIERLVRASRLPFALT